MNQFPWVDEIASVVLHYLVHQRLNVFEWGSGGSTIWFGKLCNSVVSVEHDKSWFDKVGDEIIRIRLKNVSLSLREPVANPLSNDSQILPGYDFTDYINEINENQNQYDLIMVDGRARVKCFEQGLNHLRPKGVILLHDWERGNYGLCSILARQRGLKIGQIFEERGLLICRKV